MNSAVPNFLLSNLTLILLMAGYLLFLQSGTSNHFNRGYLLASLIIAPLIPYLHLSRGGLVSLPIVNNMISTVSLSHVTGDTGTPNSFEKLYAMMIIGWLYWGGFFLLAIRLIIRLFKTIRHLRRIPFKQSDGFRIFLSKKDEASFSFFRYIFIGQSESLSLEEKKAVVLHEKTQARSLHSLDLILLELMQVVFWFNPILLLYRRSLRCIHEFEADKTALAEINRSAYCNFLARSALRSLDVDLAIYFNGSITLKRIAMISQVNQRANGWRLFVSSLTFVAIFLAVTCHGQMANQITMRNSAYPRASLREEVNPILSGFQGNSKGVISQKKTFFYFCTSRGMESVSDGPKETILLTKVTKITCDEASFRTIANKWQAYVDNTCKNNGGCTSDLNYYETVEAAQAEFLKYERKYADATKFNTSMVNFKP